MLRIDESINAWMPASGTCTRPYGNGACCQYATAWSRAATASSSVGRAGHDRAAAAVQHEERGGLARRHGQAFQGEPACPLRASGHFQRAGDRFVVVDHDALRLAADAERRVDDQPRLERARLSAGVLDVHQDQVVAGRAGRACQVQASKGTSVQLAGQEGLAVGLACRPEKPIGR